MPPETSGRAFDVILKALGTAVLTPSDALIVKVYVVFVEIFGKVPEIAPVEEFSVIPLGKDEPDAKEYVIVESSVATADTEIETAS